MINSLPFFDKNNLPKKIKILFMCFGICFKLCSQSRISGKVVDYENSYVPYCSIALVKASDTSLYKGTIASENGEYLFTAIAKGNYFLKVNSVNYNTFLSTLIILDSNTTLVLADITLKSSTINLNEISILTTKKTIENKNGVITMNVEDSPLATGNSVFELLKKLPTVTISNQNSFSINGKGGVKIIIDGHLQLLSDEELVNVLSSMSANVISKIEVINNPSAKYDAEGVNGLINIVTKKVKITGLSGNFNSTINKGILYGGNIGTSLNYKVKKGVVFTNYNFSQMNKYFTNTFERLFNINDTNSSLKQKESNRAKQLNYFTKIGGDYYLNKKSTLGICFTGSLSQKPTKAKSLIIADNYNVFGFDNFESINQLINKNYNGDINLNFEHIFDTLDSKLSFSTDYYVFNQNKSQINQNKFLNAQGIESQTQKNYQSNNNIGITIHTQVLDFTKSFNKWKLEAGAKSTFISNKNSYTIQKEYLNVYTQDILLSNNFLYHESIAAAYFIAHKKLKYTAIQFGCRSENTIVNAKTLSSSVIIKRNYINFFPSLNINYSKQKNHNFQLNLSSGINRPSYLDINPNIVYTNYYEVNSGNPNLLPQTSVNASFVHTFKEIIYSTIGISTVKNIMLYADRQLDSSKLLIASINNLQNAKSYYYSLYIQKSVMSWWNLTVYACPFYFNYSGKLNNAQLYSQYFGFESSVNNDIILPKKYKLQINGIYNAPIIYGYYKYKSIWSVDLAIQKKLIKDKLTINLTLNDLFLTYKYNFTAMYQNINQRFLNNMDTRRILLTISYNFGKLKVENRKINTNDDEKNRINSQQR